jgi:hypothetical protein
MHRLIPPRSGTGRCAGRTSVCVYCRCRFSYWIFVVAVSYFLRPVAVAAYDEAHLIVPSRASIQLPVTERAVSQRRSLTPPRSELYPDVNERPFACGPASIAVAFAVLGVKVSNQELGMLADREQRTNFADLAAYASSKELYVEAVRMGPEHLASLRNVAILQILSPMAVAENMKGEEALHFVVFAGPVDDEVVYVFDPRAGSGMRGPFPLAELAEMWTGRALVLSKYPIDLSRLGVAGHSSRGGISRSIFILLVLLGLGGMLLPVARIVLRKRSVADCSTTACLALILLSCSAFVSGGKLLATTASPEDPNGISPQNSERTIKSRYVIGAVPYSTGVVSKGTMIKHEFELVNPDRRTIDIRLGKSSCVCLDSRIIGSPSIPPGERTRVAITLHANKGGKMTAGVLLHLSSQKDPIPLVISTIVTDDTRIVPATLDFGAVARNSPSPLRPLRIVHHGTKEQAFQIREFLFSVPFLTVAHQDEPKEVLVGNGVVEYRHHVQIAVDPNASPLGDFTATLTVSGVIGKNPVQFHLLCSGSVLPIVAASPNRIMKIQKTFPKELDVEIDLKTARSADVVVRSVESEGIRLAGWSQKRNSKTGSTLLTLRIQPSIEKGRSAGAFFVTLAAPAGEVVNIPVRLIEVGVRTNDKDKD